MNWFRKIAKKETERKILEALKEKGNLRFEQLLKEANISRSTLTIHLKELLKQRKIRRFYNTYQITYETVAKIQIEGMIKYLGKVAVHQIIRTKLNLPIEFDINKEMKRYSETKPKNVSWKKLFEFLQEEYQLTI